MINKNILEAIIYRVLLESLNNTCPHCDRMITFQDYGDPAEKIAEALIEKEETWLKNHK